MKSINWEGIFDALNPTLVCKRYEVSLSGWNSGRFKYFWLKKNAIKYFEKHKRLKDYPFINVYDHFIHDSKASHSNKVLLLRRWRDLNSKPPPIIIPQHIADTLLTRERNYN